MQPKTHQPLPVSFDSAGICVLESRHSDDFRMDWTRHEYWKVLLVIDGIGRIATRAAAWPISAGTLVIVPAGIDHRLSDAAQTPLTLYILCVANAAPFQPLSELPSEPLRVITELNAVASAQRTMRRLLFEKTSISPAQSLIKTGSVCSLLGDL